MTEKEVLLQVQDLKKHFPIRSGLLRRQTGAVKAVDGVSFDIYGSTGSNGIKSQN